METVRLEKDIERLISDLEFELEMVVERRTTGQHFGSSSQEIAEEGNSAHFDDFPGNVAHFPSESNAASLIRLSDSERQCHRTFGKKSPLSVTQQSEKTRLCSSVQNRLASDNQQDSVNKSNDSVNKSNNIPPTHHAQKKPRDSSVTSRDSQISSRAPVMHHVTSPPDTMETLVAAAEILRRGTAESLHFEEPPTLDHSQSYWEVGAETETSQLFHSDSLTVLYTPDEDVDDAFTRFLNDLQISTEVKC